MHQRKTHGASLKFREIWEFTHKLPRSSYEELQSKDFWKYNFYMLKGNQATSLSERLVDDRTSMMKTEGFPALLRMGSVTNRVWLESFQEKDY